MLTAVPARILMVDDEMRVLDAYRRLLRSHREHWTLEFASGAVEALACAEQLPPDLVLSDVTMPGRTGLDLLADLKERPHLAHVPVIIVTGARDASLKRHALDLGAVDLLAKPVDAADLTARIASALRIKHYEDQLRRYAAELEERVAERTRELERSRMEIILRLAAAGECRDTETGHHVVRVALVSHRIAQALGLPVAFCNRILLASPLHDLGKVGIPDHILRKPGVLSEIERETMQRHCTIGYSILCSAGAMSVLVDEQLGSGDTGNELLEMAARIALHHHERWDGTGYPHQLSGDAIPIEARIVAAADCFDALCSRRVYKPAIPLDEVRTMMAAESGRHLDPDIWQAMLRTWPALTEIVSSYADFILHEAAA